MPGTDLGLFHTEFPKPGARVSKALQLLVQKHCPYVGASAAKPQRCQATFRQAKAPTSEQLVGAACPLHEAWLCSQVGHLPPPPATALCILPGAGTHANLRGQTLLRWQLVPRPCHRDRQRTRGQPCVSMSDEENVCSRFPWLRGLSRPVRMLCE